MKAQQIRELSDEELQQKEEELSEQLFKLRFQQAIGQDENPQKLKLIKRDVARVKTVVRERQLFGQTVAKREEKEEEKEEKKKKKGTTDKKEDKLNKKEEKEKEKKEEKRKKKTKKKEKSSEKEK
jgi:large subunit ribosomal protein L29